MVDQPDSQGRAACRTLATGGGSDPVAGMPAEAVDVPLATGGSHRAGRAYPPWACAARFAISAGDTSSTWVEMDHVCPNGSVTMPERSP